MRSTKMFALRLVESKGTLLTCVWLFVGLVLPLGSAFASPRTLRLEVSPDFSQDPTYQALHQYLTRRGLLTSARSAPLVHLKQRTAGVLELRSEGSRLLHQLQETQSSRVKAKGILLALEGFLVKVYQRRAARRLTRQRRRSLKRSRPKPPRIRAVISPKKLSAARETPQPPRRATPQPPPRREKSKPRVPPRRVVPRVAFQEAPRPFVAPRRRFFDDGPALGGFRLGLAMHGQWGISVGDPYIGPTLVTAFSMTEWLSAQITASVGWLLGRETTLMMFQGALTLHFTLARFLSRVSFELLVGAAFGAYLHVESGEHLLAFGPRAGPQFNFFLTRQCSIFLSVPFTWYPLRMPAGLEQSRYGEWTFQVNLGVHFHW